MDKISKGPNIVSYVRFRFAGQVILQPSRLLKSASSRCHLMACNFLWCFVSRRNQKEILMGRTKRTPFSHRRNLPGVDRQNSVRKKRSIEQVSTSLGGLHAATKLRGRRISKAVRDVTIQAAKLNDEPLRASILDDASRCDVCGQEALLWVDDAKGFRIVTRVCDWICDDCRRAAPKS